MLGRNTCLVVVCLILGSLLLYVTYVAVELAPLHVDAGAYLRLARHLANGLVLYRDVSCGYTPLGILVFTGLMQLFNNETPYQLFVLCIVAFEILTSLFAYKIFVLMVSDRLLGLLCSLFLMFMFFFYEGIFILLEPFVACFSVLSIYLVFSGEHSNRKLFLAGICASCAFLSKQYGVLSLLPLIYYIASARNEITRFVSKLAILLSGFSAPILLWIGYYWVRFGLPPLTLLNLISGRHYGAQEFNHNPTLLLVIIAGPVLAMLVIRVHSWSDNELKRRCYALLVGLSAYLAPLYIRTFTHYWILIAPYLSLLGFVWISTLSKEKDSTPVIRYSLIAGVSVLFLIYPIRNLQFSVLFSASQIRERQFSIARQVDTLIAPQEATLVFAREELCYLSKNIYDPAMNFRVGIGCGFYLFATANELMKLLGAAEVLVIENISDGVYRGLTKRMKSNGFDLPAFVGDHFSLTNEFDANYQIWRRK